MVHNSMTLLYRRGACATYTVVKTYYNFVYYTILCENCNYYTTGKEITLRTRIHENFSLPSVGIGLIEKTIQNILDNTLYYKS